MSDHNKTGGPAFPQSLAVGPSDDVYSSDQYQERCGMSLRDYFAAKAMQARITFEKRHDLAYEEWLENESRIAYEIADAMLAERSKQ